MRFATFTSGGSERVGVIDGDSVIPLPEALGDLVDVIAGGDEMRQRVREVVANPDQRIPVVNIELCAPVRRFRRDVLCTGWNYWDHFEEGRGKRDGQEVERPTAPTFFTKSPGVVIGPRDPIAFDPRISAKWDYEAELVVVIGRRCRSIPEKDAASVIWGYCLANDISHRDLQRRHGGQWLKGKSIDQTMPFGPWIVTADEIDASDVRLSCIVNGQLVQNATVQQMAFPISKLIAELSFGMTLHPGDILLTGTPSGVGNAREPQLFLKEGDEVIVRGSGLGELHNRLTLTDLAGDSDVKIPGTQA